MLIRPTADCGFARIFAETMTPTASICACHRVALERLAAVGEIAFGGLRVVAVSAGLTIIDTVKVSMHEMRLLIE
jgi:hypothetical protein